jgi:predicted component of type VI protein secretion system
MEPEINLVLNTIHGIEQELEIATKKMPDNELDIAILDDEIIQLENKLVECREKLNNLRQLMEYQAKCNHVFIEDLIDISPERSMVIRYCVHCQYSE